MTSKCFIVNVNGVAAQDLSSGSNEAKPPILKEKVMSYEEKSVGSTPFFKCEACPYMALAEDDIKFHLFTVHPELAKNNGLADNIQIPCPGCTSVFDAEETLRTHLRNHHKMGIKDVKKMVKSLVQIALKNANLKKVDKKSNTPPPTPITEDVPDVKIPQVIEITPDAVGNNDSLLKGVTFISVDELHKMSTPNFDKVDAKDIIQEASINIVYSNEVSRQYVNMAEVSTTGNVLQVSNVTPDLISSIQPRPPVVSGTNNNLTSPADSGDTITHPLPQLPKKGRPRGSKTVPVSSYENNNSDLAILKKKYGHSCSVSGCHIRLKCEDKLIYHTRYIIIILFGHCTYLK